MFIVKDFNMKKDLMLSYLAGKSFQFTGNPSTNKS